MLALLMLYNVKRNREGLRSVYADIQDNNGFTTRICGTLGNDSEVVMINIVKGSRLGGFLLSRFEGNKLTAKTLKKLFEG